MSAIALASTNNMSREEWLKFRRLGIGGSDASAIAGMSRWKSPMEVWMEKTGQLEAEEQSEAAYWGTVLEDVVAKEFARRSGLKVQKRNAILQHPKYEFMLANIDRMITDPDRGKGILECKTAGEYKKTEWDDGLIPEEYALQVHHYLMVTGLQFARIAVLIGGNKFEIRDIDRDDEIIDYMTKIESDFWQLVKKGVPPAMDGSDSACKLLKIMYPESQPTSIDLPSEADQMVEDFIRLQEMEKTIVSEKDELANKLKNMMAENELAYTSGHKLSWKTIVSKRFDSNAFKSVNKDLYEKFLNESRSRRFTVSVIKRK